MTENKATLKWDETGQPLSSAFNDIYFSKKNGLEESRYVFLNGNRLAKRFSKLVSDQHFCVGEMGFGTGLNFLSCWQLWKEHALSSARLTFISTEKHPLTAEELNRSLSLWPELTGLRKNLFESYRKILAPHKTTNDPLFYTFNFNNVRLILIIGDAEESLKNISQASVNSAPDTQSQKVDAWFLDGFAPAKNPDMWSQTLFNTMNSLSHPLTTLATFTAAGHVRRALIQAGFSVEKIKGFANKREMIIGQFETKKYEIENSKKITPWAINRHHQTIQNQQTIAIIGAGMAGCHSAYSLAKRGFNVTLIDSHEAVASEASGNPQGVIYAKLSAHAQRLSDFNLLSLLYAQQHYSKFWQAHPDIGGACGVLQLSQTKQQKEQHHIIGEQFKNSAFLDFLNAEQASEKAGIKLKYPGLFFPHCGWLTPQNLCQWLINDVNITTIYNTHVLNIEKQNQAWLLTANRKTSLNATPTTWQETFDFVVIANANAANTFAPTQWLPTKPIRGQISYIPSINELSQLKTVICAEGYIAPCRQMGDKQQHAIGATYNLDHFSTALSEQDHHQNIQHLTQHLSLDPASIKAMTPLGGRVGFRCTSPDYLPLVGPAPDIDAFQTDYSPLSKNARQYLPIEGSYHAGLYLNIAHGSRGLAYTPLAAEILACTLTGEPLPIAQNMVDALNPARFIIRDLRRKQAAPKNR